MNKISVINGIKGPVIMSDSRRKEIMDSLLQFRPYAHIEYAKNFLKCCLYDADVEINGLVYGTTTFSFTKCSKSDDINSEYGECQVKCTEDSYDVSCIKKISGMRNGISGSTENHYFKSFTWHELYDVVNYVKLFYMGDLGDSVLFTGAFCPPHNGHRHLVEEAAKKFDCVFIATSTQKFLENKFKKANQEMMWCFSEESRLKFLMLMTWDMPNVIISGVEKGYTYNALCDVRDRYKPKSLWFTCGSDKLEEIPRWGFHDKLMSEFGFYVLQRGDDIADIEEECISLFNNWAISEQSDAYSNISSTKVRDALSREDWGFIKNNVPTDVYNAL